MSTSEVSPACWWNGVRGDGPAATSRGLHYGDGVFRTMLIHDGQVVDLDRHLDKLEADAGALSLAFARSTLLRDIEGALAAGEPGGVVKLMLIRAGNARGYRPATAEIDRLLIRYPSPEFAKRDRAGGIIAMRSPVVLAQQPRLAGIKHLNRLEQTLASRDWPASVDEAILSDEQGHPICGTRCNVFWVEAGALLTPALDRCGVAGVMRGKLLALAHELGIGTVIGRHGWASLETSREAFLCNSLIGIWPLRQLDGVVWSAPGPLTVDLIRALAHPTLRAS